MSFRRDLFGGRLPPLIRLRARLLRAARGWGFGTFFVRGPARFGRGTAGLLLATITTAMPKTWRL